MGVRMILYFSGTGNSRLAAEQLAVLMDEQEPQHRTGSAAQPSGTGRIDIGSALYSWTLPHLVLSYLAQHQELNHNKLHAVMTCGGALGAGASITRQLRSLGFERVNVHAVVMTTNYIPLHQVQSPEAAAQAIRAALDKLPGIAADIRHNRGARTSAFLAWGLPIAQGMYNRARRTWHFRATTQCIGCGLCERIAPARPSDC